MASGNFFSCLHKSQCVPGSHVPRKSFNEWERLIDIFSFQQFFHSLVSEKKLSFQSQNSFSGHIETEMSRFNDASMNWTNWNFKNSFPSHVMHWIGHIGFFKFRVPGKIFAQRKNSLRHILMIDQAPWIWMTFGLNPKHILQISFIPMRSHHSLCD